MKSTEIAREILSEENKQRKAASRREREIYDEKMHQYVFEYLRQRYDLSTVKEMPIISCISLLKKIINKFASIYMTPPRRVFNNATPEQQKALEQLYADIKANRRLKLANRFYKLQNQTFLQFLIKDGKPILRNFNKHHIDVVPDEIDPELAAAYAVSSFNNYRYLIDTKKQTATGYQEKAHTNKLATSDLKISQESKTQEETLSKMKIAVWTDQENYIMDGNGSIQTEIASLGFKPFVDIHSDKDFKFFVDSPEVDADFCIQFNGILTSIGQILEMQGFAVGYLIALAGTKTNNLVIGPNKIINLEIPEDNPAARPEFGYASPSADIGGAMKYAEVVSQMYFWAKGIETSINKDGAQQHPSGIEKLLSMIDEFRATQDDLEIFVSAESELFEVIKSWARIGAFAQTKYKVGNLERVEISVEFAKPELVMTGIEKVDLGQKKEQAGYASRIDSIIDIYGLKSRDEAISKIEQIEKDKEIVAKMTVKDEPEEVIESETDTGRDISDNRPE